ncbi:Magnesium-chelatase 38 kDa subunit [compost metagenome]
MNPEEGELRPQLLDRFGLNVALEGLPEPHARQQIIRRRLAFDSDPQAFCAQWAAAQAQLRERCQQARHALALIALDDQALAWITERCYAAGVDGLRADLVWLRAARAHCAWRGGAAIEEADVDAVAEFALRHRRRVTPQQQQPPSTPPEAGQQGADNQGGQGDWGALPPQPVVSGARREVPNWAKKP